MLLSDFAGIVEIATRLFVVVLTVVHISREEVGRVNTSIRA